MRAEDMRDSLIYPFKARFKLLRLVIQTWRHPFAVVPPGLMTPFFSKRGQMTVIG